MVNSDTRVVTRLVERIRAEIGPPDTSPPYDAEDLFLAVTYAIAARAAWPGELSVWLRLTIDLALPAWSQLVTARETGSGHDDSTMDLFAARVLECAAVALLVFAV